MAGSQASLACPNAYLNTIVAEEVDWVADKLEGTPAGELDAAIKNLVKEVYLAHKRIIFNGNGYTDEWVAEAAKRGLFNNKSTPEALACMVSKKNVDLVVKHGIFTKTEVLSRCEIQYELYNKTLNIEALTMLDMLYKDLLPAAKKYLKDLSTIAISEKALGLKPDTVFLKKLQEATAAMYKDGETLSKELLKAEKIEDQKKASAVYHGKVLTAMEALRKSGDAVEGLLGKEYLPYPTYGDLLFGLN
jgi:glutamine synthetase